MKKIILPKRLNYISAFLTFRCNLSCPYCINKQRDFAVPKEMTGDDWIKGLSRIETREDLPLTLSGGEPTIHRDFYNIVSNLHGKKLDLLTNGKFDVGEFTGHIHSGVFLRKAPYASIRFSHHKGLNDEYLMDKIGQLQSTGYSIGVWGFDNNDNTSMKRFCDENKVDYRIKEFLDKDHGTYRYPEAINGIKKDTVLCTPSEFLISPSGHIHRCHADLYANRNPIGHILDEEIIFPDCLPCDYCGECNPCDVKNKTNRLQEIGHCSVEIREC